MTNPEAVKDALANADAGYWELNDKDARAQMANDVSVLAERVRELEEQLADAEEDDDDD